VAGDQRPLAVAGGKPVAGVTKADGAIEEIVVRLQTVVSHQSTVISQGKNWSEDEWGPLRKTLGVNKIPGVFD